MSGAAAAAAAAAEGGLVNLQKIRKKLLSSMMAQIANDKLFIEKIFSFLFLFLCLSSRASEARVSAKLRPSFLKLIKFDAVRLLF